jgi:hypothetical protein
LSSVLVKSKVRLYQTNDGSNPIRTWLMRLSSQERKQVCEELRAAQIACMVGLPLGERIEEQMRILGVELSKGKVLFLYDLDSKTNELIISLAQYRPRWEAGQNFPPDVILDPLKFPF